MKLPILKLYQITANQLTLEELKIYMLIYHSKNLKIEFLNNTELWKDQLSRELIITPIKDCYGTISTIVFSINGSPPKGIAIMLGDSYMSKCIGNMTFFSRGGRSKEYYVEIVDYKIKENG